VTAIAVDGGNSKTHLTLVREDGALLAFVRGPLSSPHHIGEQGCLDVLERLLRDAAAEAGLDPEARPLAEVAAILLAGVDFPAEQERLGALADGRGWAGRTTVANDTFAVLRAGTERGWGVAVVCGAGINCVGVAPDGRHARFPALGAISGDWGGGVDLGYAAVAAAARSEDRRGPRTTLERAVPAHFGLQTPLELAEAFHSGRVSQRRIVELAPVVLAAAGDDAVAAGIVDRLADEVVRLVRVTLERLELAGSGAEVVLGGGVLQSGDPRLLASIEAGLREFDPAATAHVASSPPVVGAALLALDELEATPEAAERLRDELGRAVDAEPVGEVAGG
jgi:N-acetylglucosamine kinase-like BadF-type ATPase